MLQVKIESKVGATNSLRWEREQQQIGRRRTKLIKNDRPRMKHDSAFNIRRGPSLSTSTLMSLWLLPSSSSSSSTLSRLSSYCRCLVTTVAGKKPKRSSECWQPSLHLERRALALARWTLVRILALDSAQVWKNVEFTKGTLPKRPLGYKRQSQHCWSRGNYDYHFSPTTEVLDKQV